MLCILIPVNSYPVFFSAHLLKIMLLAVSMIFSGALSVGMIILYKVFMIKKFEIKNKFKPLTQNHQEILPELPM